MRYNPDADRPTYDFGAGADEPASPPEPPPQAYTYQGGEAFEAAQTGTHHWDGPQHDPANTTDWGSFHGPGWAESFEVPQTGTYWQEPTYTEFGNDTGEDFPPDVQEAPQPPSEPFTAGFFAA